MEKDQAILKVLQDLENELGSGSFEIVDHWEADLCAIGIASPKNNEVLVYINTFRKKHRKYDVHLELPALDNEDELYINAGDFSDVDFNTLAKIVREHLGRNG